MFVLLLGGTGQIGRECLALDWPVDIKLVAPDHAALDLTRSPAIVETIAARPWDIVINENAPYGIYHYCAVGETTWFGFAKAIVVMASRLRGGTPELVPITTAEYPTPAKRPGDTRLDCTAIIRAFGARQRP